MNKKYMLLLIPLLLMPLIAFGYAHFTDLVVKKYKVHVGSVYLNVTAFHVNEWKMPDVDNDGMIFGDELLVNIYEDTALCTWFEEITADPITGGFILNTTTWMINGGKLPFEVSWDFKWDGPYDADPCFVIPPSKAIGTLQSPPWHFSVTIYKWHLGVRSGPYAPTQTHYKPGDLIEVIQVIKFDQPNPGDSYQKDWQCKWIKLWVEFKAQDVYETGSSNTVPNLPEHP